MSDIPAPFAPDANQPAAKPTVSQLLGPVPAKPTVSSLLDAPPPVDRNGLLDAAAQGFGHYATPMAPETVQALRDAGIYNDYSKGQNSILRTFNEALVGLVVDPLIRRIPLGVYGALRGMAEAPPASDLTGRALQVASEAGTAAMEAFPGGHLTGFPSVPGPTVGAAAIESALQRAREALPEGAPSADILAAQREAVASLAPETAGTVPRQVYPEAIGPPEPYGPPANLAPDLHAVARQAQPELFAEYDALSARRDALSTKLNEWRELRRNGSSPEVSGIDARMESMARAGIPLDKIRSERARAVRNIPEGTEPTPEMEALQKQVQEADYAMRDLAPQVSAAYRQAREGVPEAAETAAREPVAEEPPVAPAAAPPVAEATPAAIATPETAEAPPTPPLAVSEPVPEIGGAPAMPPAVETPPRVPEAPAPRPAEPLQGGIAGDVSRQLVAAGRPAEEADAAAALVQAHYEARAQRFDGALGTAEDLYRNEAPTVRAGRGVMPAEAAELELAQPRRGSIRLATDDAKNTITLFKDADASTFIHETGHQWLEELISDARREEAPAGLATDAATVRRWLGVNEGEEIPRRAHEKFARGFERYMMEGHAPSQALANVFAKFKGWLTRIYQTVSRLRSPINNDIRGVFDRMLATPEEKPVIAPAAEPREFVTTARGTASRGGAFEKVPQEPLPLTEFLRRLGGVQNQGGEISHVIGGSRFRPGLISGKGLTLDDATLRAWEEGYFPDATERPTPDDLIQAIHEEAQGRKRYSARDESAVAAYHEAIARNAEVDRLGQHLGIDPRHYSREEFFRLASEHLSFEEQARAVGSFETATEHEFADAERRAKEFVESRGDAWEPDAVYAKSEPRTLEDMEREYKSEVQAARNEGGRESSAVVSGPASGSARPLQVGVRQGRSGAGVAGRNDTQARPAAGRSTAGSEAAAGGFGTELPDRYVDKAGNIRLDNIATAEDVKQALRDAAERNGDFIQQRRGVVSDAQRDALADLMGTTPDKILSREIGQAFSDSEIKALEKLLAQSSGNIRVLAAKFAETAAEADDVALTEALLRHDMVQGMFSQATAEAGRALRALQRSKAYWATSEGVTEQALKQGLGDITGRTFNQRLKLAKAIRELDQAGQVGRVARDLTKPGLFDWAQATMINAFLSGPFTHLGYTAAGELFGLFRATAETGTAATIGAARQALGLGSELDRAHFGEMQAQLYGQMRGSWRGIQAAWRAIKSNQAELPTEVQNAPVLPGFAGQPQGTFGNVIPNPRVAGVRLPIGDVLEAPSRMVAALHSFNWTTFYEQSKGAQAFRQAVSEGLTGDNLSARIAYLVDHPTDEIIRRASEEASGGALMTRPAYDSFMGEVARLTNWGVQLGDVPLPGGHSLPLGTLRPGKFIDPFVVITANVINTALGRGTPLALFSQVVRDDLMMKNGGAAFDRTAGRILAGSALMTAAGGLYFAGKMNPTGPKDPKEAALWRRIHGAPHGLNVGGLSFDTLRLGPLGMQMSIAADLAHAIEHIGKDDGAKVASALVEAFAQTILDESFARGPSELMRAVDDPDRYGASYIRNFVSSAMPYSVGLSQIARQVDPYTHHARSLMDAVLAKIPGVSMGLQPVYDVWGDPAPSRSWAGTYYEHIQNDPIDRRLEELGIAKGPPDRHIGGIELTDQQYADYSRIGGRYARMLVEHAVGMPGFANMPPEYQIKLINEAVSSARKQAAGIVTIQSATTPDDIMAKRRAAMEAAVSGASHEAIKDLRKLH